MVTQLRRYRIRAGQAAQFAREWHSGVAPLRQAHGFHVEGWLLAASDEFIWVLEHDNESSFQQADTAYYESPQRNSLDPDPARLIESADKDWVIRIC